MYSQSALPNSSSFSWLGRVMSSTDVPICGCDVCVRCFFHHHHKNERRNGRTTAETGDISFSYSLSIKLKLPYIILLLPSILSQHRAILSSIYYRSHNIKNKPLNDEFVTSSEGQRNRQVPSSRSCIVERSCDTRIKHTLTIIQIDLTAYFNRIYYIVVHTSAVAAAHDAKRDQSRGKIDSLKYSGIHI